MTNSIRINKQCDKRGVVKPINRILEAIKKKPDNMTEKQEKEYPESLAKAKILFNDPSQDMKIYYYFSDISSPNVKTDKDFLDRVSDNIYKYLESDEYLKNKWLEEK